MNIFSKIKSLFSKTIVLDYKTGAFYTGVNQDTRTLTQKAKDFLHSERSFAGASAEDCFGNKKITKVDHENQYYTSSCVAHGSTGALEEEIKMDNGGEAIRLSKSLVYRLRSNYPNPGMWHQEAFEILRKTGSCLFGSLPTPTTEEKINETVIKDAHIKEASLHKGKLYWTIDNSTIDKIADIAQKGHRVSIVIYASQEDWAKSYPTTYDSVTYNEAPVRHDVCVLPKSGFTENGVKYVSIVDSAGFGGIFLRHLSQDFVGKRVVSAIYWDTVDLVAGYGVKPQFIFSKNLSQSMKIFDVLMLQKCLYYEGLLPEDCLTGYFGPYTTYAVKSFQLKYGTDILTPLGLTEPTGNVMKSTLKKLNEIYG